MHSLNMNMCMLYVHTSTYQVHTGTYWYIPVDTGTCVFSVSVNYLYGYPVHHSSNDSSLVGNTTGGGVEGRRHLCKACYLFCQ